MTCLNAQILMFRKDSLITLLFKLFIYFNMIHIKLCLEIQL